MVSAPNSTGMAGERLVVEHNSNRVGVGDVDLQHIQDRCSAAFLRGRKNDPSAAQDLHCGPRGHSRNLDVPAGHYQILMPVDARTGVGSDANISAREKRGAVELYVLSEVVPGGGSILDAKREPILGIHL